MTVRLLLATRSAHKLQELQTLLHLPWLELVTLDEAGVAGEAVEDAATFRGNAIIKARFYCGLAGMPTLADDSGVEVDALGGAPGVYTKRYAGPDATDEENNAKLLAELGDLPMERRRARYRCVLAFLDPRSQLVGGRPWVMTRSGTLEGRIAFAPHGTRRLWLRPHLRAARASWAAAGRWATTRPTRRTSVSHRARAARAMARYLKKRYPNQSDPR